MSNCTLYFNQSELATPIVTCPSSQCQCSAMAACDFFDASILSFLEDASDSFSSTGCALSSIEIDELFSEVTDPSENATGQGTIGSSEPREQVSSG